MTPGSHISENGLLTRVGSCGPLHMSHTLFCMTSFNPYTIVTPIVQMRKRGHSKSNLPKILQLDYDRSESQTQLIRSSNPLPSTVWTEGLRVGSTYRWQALVFSSNKKKKKWILSGSTVGKSQMFPWRLHVSEENAQAIVGAISTLRFPEHKQAWPQGSQHRHCPEAGNSVIRQKFMKHVTYAGTLLGIRMEEDSSIEKNTFWWERYTEKLALQSEWQVVPQS